MEPAAHYREFAPCEALREHVSAFFSCTATAESLPARVVTRESVVPEFCPVAFADGHVSIVFAVGREHGETIGAMTAVRPASTDPGREMVGVYLRAARSSLFTHVPAYELTDQVVALEDLWGTAGFEISEGTSEASRIDRLEAALLRELAHSRDSNTALDVPGVAARVFRQQGRLTVQSLADAAGVSRQRLTRVFRESVGVSPKLYCRLARFRAALAQVSGRANWAQMAVKLGYTDQSHMIAEFREFSSVTPRELAKRRFFHPFLGRAWPRPTRIS